jgi:hypothetical protein
MYLNHLPYLFPKCGYTKGRQIQDFDGLWFMIIL